MSSIFSQLAAASPPAGGAAMDQIVIATAGAVIITSVLMFLGLGHRSGKVALLGKIGAHSERISGLPAWAAVPAGMTTVSLIVALFGMLWDISLHIAQGRDEGPLANPAHYFILIGLFGVFAAGFMSMVLPKERPSASAIKIGPGWYAPLGGVLITACGAFSLAGFPLDDVWHRLFGQDVTLWGPTHLMLIAGAAMTLIGLAVLLVEARRSVGDDAEVSWARKLRRIALPGAFLLGLSTFQAEFDFGVPQFRFVFHPMLVMLAAGASLLAARIWLGRGAAIGAALFFIAMRGIIAVIVGPVLGEPTPYFPLYLVAAVIVELVALRIPRERPVALGAAAGALIGTLGLASEWAWSHVFMPLPWPSELFPEGALLGFAMALAGSLIGAWIGARLSSDELPRTRPLRVAASVAAAAIALMVGYALLQPGNPSASARVALQDVEGGEQRAVRATVTVQPRDAADGAEWLTVTSWQGGDLVVDRLRELRPGVFQTTKPIPVHGNWKSMVRMHRGSELLGLPLFLPADEAIPVKEVPAEASFTRPFSSDKELLQREQKSAAPGLWAMAYGVVLAIALGFLALLAWGVHRLAKTREAVTAA